MKLMINCELFVDDTTEPETFGLQLNIDGMLTREDTLQLAEYLRVSLSGYFDQKLPNARVTEGKGSPPWKETKQ